MKRWSYWIKDIIKFFIIFFVVSALYGLFMSATVSTAHNSSFLIKGWVADSFKYGLCMWLFWINFINISHNISKINIALSMGETRKNCLIGINISNLSGICVMLIVSLILDLISQGQYISLFNVFITIPCLQIFASGMGLCINSLNSLHKRGSLALNIMHTFLVVLDMILIFAAVISTNTWSHFTDDRTNTERKLSTAFLIITAILGITLYIVGNIRMRKKISTLEVRL